MEIDYTITNHSVTVIVDGETYTVRRSAPHFLKLREACLQHMDCTDSDGCDEARDTILKHLTVKKAVKSWAEGTWFEVEGDKITYQKVPVPEVIAQRIFKLVAEGKSPMGIAQFWLRLCANPSPRSTEQLFPFLNHCGIPIVYLDDPKYDGYFLAYKGVTSDYKDKRTQTLDNRPGNVHTMDRHLISDDPNCPCHAGLHVGDLSYAQGFGARVVICLVDPKDVVCIPYDSSYRKMRVEKYEVIGYWNGEHLPSTYVTQEDLPFLSGRDDSQGHLDPRALDYMKKYEALGYWNAQYLPNTYATPEDLPSLSDGDDFQGHLDPRVLDYEEEDYEDFEEVDYEEPQAEIQTPPPVEVKASNNREPEPGFYDKLDNQGYSELIQHSIQHLRWYATYRVKLVGASKIPGGKPTLVDRILGIRRKVS